jgi:hypothetical protein
MPGDLLEGFVEGFVERLRASALHSRESIAPTGHMGNVGHVRAETLEEVARQLTHMLEAYARA